MICLQFRPFKPSYFQVPCVSSLPPTNDTAMTKAVATFSFHSITITLERERQPQFLQLLIASEKGDYSEETAREIDCEVRRIIDEQYGRVRRLLEEKKAVLQQGAKLLKEREVITGAELKAIMDVDG